MLSNFNSVMKMVTNKSDLLVCGDCLKFFDKEDNCCPACLDDSNGIKFSDFGDYDQSYIIKNK